MIYDGSLLLLHLKISDEYVIVGGMKATKLALNTQAIDSSNLSSGSWRQLANGGGLKHMDISISGSFSNSEAEKAMRSLAFNGKLAEYKISFASGEVIIGKFQITYYERLGIVSEEETYTIGLSSSEEYVLIDS